MALFFLVRVEMHGAVPGDYEDLHERFAASDFVRYIVSGQNRRYQLPSGEYANRAASTSQAVLERARAIVAVVWPDSEILVSEVTSWWSAGLRPI